MDSFSESSLISLVSHLISLESSAEFLSMFVSRIVKIVYLVKSMDLDSQPKPESELMSLVTQTISVFNSMDLDSQPKPLFDLISLIPQKIYHKDMASFPQLLLETLRLEPEPELISLIYQICYLVFSMDSKWKKLIALSPQMQVRLENGKYRVVQLEQVAMDINKWKCFPIYWNKFKLTKGDYKTTHFYCFGCKGQNHKEHGVHAPVEVKHPLHPKHSLQLVVVFDEETRDDETSNEETSDEETSEVEERARKCFCCGKELLRIFYYCSTCDCAMNIVCVNNPADLSIDHPKWHKHPLALFPRKASLTCDVCALDDSSSRIYMCPPCDFVVHLKCLNLPRLIRISRHPSHRISFTPSFDQGDWSCGVCRKKMDNEFGGFYCIKKDCSYAAHSRCATQTNVWDGKDLEGMPEETEETLVPFVTISDGVIRHFSHEQHHLRLDENTARDYDDSKECQACVAPIYFGNFYSCIQCDFILHEACANLSRKMYHPVHQHLLTLVAGESARNTKDLRCSICPSICTGFCYECKECPRFMLDVQCATISEPLLHKSHQHPLFLTSKPKEQRICSVCKVPRRSSTNETFNCIEECNFTLCFMCATLPQKVRYKHDKHVLTLFYGDEETSTTMTYWCEVCEGKVNPKEGVYMCDGYCCVTLHIECLIGKDLYMKPGSSVVSRFCLSKVQRNNRMTRPICHGCKKRCQHRITFFHLEFIFCSQECIDIWVMSEFISLHSNIL